MSSKVLEPAFQGVGQKVGIEIWRIENSQPVPLPKSDYGRFYSGDSYIILKTTGKAGAYMYDIHFWLGKNTNQEESGTAAIKAVELDAILGGRAVLHREPQGHESNRFLSCFRPCIIPLEGGVASGSQTPEEEKRLYTCKGKRIARLKQVPFNRSSLNHDDIFILDAKDKIFQFNGANTDIQERSKALEVMKLLKDKYHEGKCKVAIVDDGKLQEEGESGEFWAMFGGFAPIGKKVASEHDIIPERTPAKLFCISGGKLQDVGGQLTKSILQNGKCYLLYCGTEVFIWVGRATQVEDRKAAMQAAEEFIVDKNLPQSTRVTRLIQGYETSSFRSNFGSWPSCSAAHPPEDSRGKVAALLKQQGGGLKGQTKSSPVEEEVIPLLGENGKLEVWRIDGEAKTPLAKEDIGKFYSGDCCICLYSYHSNEKKEDHFLCCWIGKDSIQEDQQMASQLATSMFNSLKGRPVQGRVYQGKEPAQFVAIFQPLVVLKGGLSSGYKSYIADKGLKDETYGPEITALFEISGTSVHNIKALQVDPVAESMNSYGCFVLQSGTAVFTWYGNQSSVEQQQLAAKVVELLKSRVPVKFAKEGKESLAFWLALGGKRGYTSKKVMQEIVREPHLFTISTNKGKFETEEVYNFEQDDLLSEDVMILDTHAEVFVWVGQSVDPKEKQNAFDFGQKYIDLAAPLEGLSPQVPLYRVPEGSEPCFFTTYFSWDPAKATVQGNSFKKKAALLFGPGCTGESEDNKPQGNKGGATQRASAMAALTNAFKSSYAPKTTAPPRMPIRGSQRAAAVAALSNVLTAEKKTPETKGPHHSPRRQHRRNPSSEPASPASVKSEEPSSAFDNNEVSEVATEPNHETKKEDLSTTNEVDSSTTKQTNEEESSTEKQTNEEESSTAKQTNEVDSSATNQTNEVDSSATKQTNQVENEDIQTTFTYEQLNTKSKNPVTGIDYKKRETYLSPEDFEAIFKMTKEAFYQLPRWKQDQLKKKVDLF